MIHPASMDTEVFLLTYLSLQMYECENYFRLVRVTIFISLEVTPIQMQ